MNNNSWDCQKLEQKEPPCKFCSYWCTNYLGDVHRHCNYRDDCGYMINDFSCFEDCRIAYPDRIKYMKEKIAQMTAVLGELKCGASDAERKPTS